MKGTDEIFTFLQAAQSCLKLSAELGKPLKPQPGGRRLSKEISSTLQPPTAQRRGKRAGACKEPEQLSDALKTHQRGQTSCVGVKPPPGRGWVGASQHWRAVLVAVTAPTLSPHGCTHGHTLGSSVGKG